MTSCRSMFQVVVSLLSNDRNHNYTWPQVVSHDVITRHVHNLKSSVYGFLFVANHSGKST